MKINLDLIRKKTARIRRLTEIKLFRLSSKGDIDWKSEQFQKIITQSEQKLLNLGRKYLDPSINYRSNKNGINTSYFQKIFHKIMEDVNSNSIKPTEKVFKNQGYYQVWCLEFFSYCLDHINLLELPFSWFPNDIKEIKTFFENKFRLAFTHLINYSDLFDCEDYYAYANEYKRIYGTLEKKEDYYKLENKYRLPVSDIEIFVFHNHYGIEHIPESCKKRIEKTTFVDCGAYIGDTALILNELNPHNIYSFEPNSTNFNNLKKTIKLNRLECVHPIKCSLGEKSNGAYLLDLGSGSFINPGIGESVKVIDIDSFFLPLKENIGLIKMDIEGSELEAIKGAEEIIKTYHPILLISLYHTGKDFFEIPKLIKNWVPEYNLRFLNLDKLDPVLERILLAY